MGFPGQRYALQVKLPVFDFLVADNMVVGGDDYDGHSAYPLYGDAVAAIFRTTSEEISALGDIAQRFADAGWQVDVKDGVITLTAPAETDDVIFVARELAGAYTDQFVWNLPLAVSGSGLHELETMPVLA
jgi:hypothetical protein